MDMSVYQANLIIRRIKVSSQLKEQLAKDKSSEPILLYTSIGKDGKSSLKLVRLVIQFYKQSINYHNE